MDIPRHSSAVRSSTTVPEIYHDPSSTNRSRMSSRTTSYSSSFFPSSGSNPMSIPNAQEPAPPPVLAPPRYVEASSNGPDLAWIISNSLENPGWSKQSSSVNPSSSLHGNFPHRTRNPIDPERPEFKSRETSKPAIKAIPALDARRDTCSKLDEGYGSLSGTSAGSSQSNLDDSIAWKTSFKSAVHENFHENFRINEHVYDRSVLQKLDPRRAAENVTSPVGYPRSPFSSSLNDLSPTRRILPEHTQLAQKAVSLPVGGGRFNSVESPLARWADGGFPPVSPQAKLINRSGIYDYRSPTDRDDVEKSPLYCSRRQASGLRNSEDNSSIASWSHQESFDQNSSADQESDFIVDETTGLYRLHIDDDPRRSDEYSPPSAVGHKRRASSPLQGDSPPSLHNANSASDLHRRRESGSRTSPAPRYHSNHGSVSSTTSGPLNSSHSSTLATSSITTLSSFGRLSPAGFSPGALSPMSVEGSDSPLAMTLSIDPNPRGSNTRPIHHRTGSETRPASTSRKASEVLIPRKSSNLKLRGGFSCECCPKKPKFFETEEDLAAHKSEKQYECAYCKNRFKNKNEAERHQNSLHLRRHSWSCAALTRYASAFHTSQTRPTEADTCGYCGEEFDRTGPHGTANEQDWDSRIQHLLDAHKFGECNHTKKFFRADHFRQHLKHSHAGTSGKWTNMLENSCMKDEPLPEPRDRSASTNSVNGSGPGRPARITEEDELI